MNQTRDNIEGLPIEDSFSPLLHRLDAAIRYRAVHPGDPILEPAERLTEFSHPTEEMVAKSKSHLEKLISTADVKKGTYNQIIPKRQNSKSNQIP
jgi:ATP-dependent DNA helicase 2 subunit 2